MFEDQLNFLRNHGYKVVPLSDVVNFLKRRSMLPPRAVAITVDDGHYSVYTQMKPVVEKYHIPVTLFIYPSAISNASYAMTWEQLAELKATGLFEVESHTYSHPNFHVEKRRLSAAGYEKLVKLQLYKPREVLESRLGETVNLIAWPFGIYDSELISAAQKAGYVAAFTIERRKVSQQDDLMAIPRFIICDSDVGKVLEGLLTREPRHDSAGIQHPASDCGTKEAQVNH